jgi:hypothetical protein
LARFFALTFVVLIAHGIIRHRLMDVRVVVHRGLTFTLAVAVSLLPVGGLLALAWPRLTDHLSADEFVPLVVAIVVVGLLIPLTRDAAGRLLDRYVYRTRVNYQRTLREASGALTRVLDLEVLLQFVNHHRGELDEFRGRGGVPQRRRARGGRAVQAGDR